MALKPSDGFRKGTVIAVLAAIALGGLAAYFVFRPRPPSSPVVVSPPLPVKRTENAAATPAAAPPARTEQIVTVQHFGRYSLRTHSAEGAALQLIDRMSGPTDSDGVAGQRDARLDLFLGQGEHKAVMTYGAKAAKPPELQVLPFEELNQGTPPRLLELALVETDLGDLQQRSYWLDVPSRQAVFIEAAGRHLADLRLWKDGTWLEGAPVADETEPKPGHPLRVERLVAWLEPGLYLLTAYGGPGMTWTQPGAEKPLILRWGIPSLSETGRRQFVTSPFGYDRWLIPGSANYFRLELPPGEKGAMDVGYYRDGAIPTAEHVVIDKTNRLSAAETAGPFIQTGQYAVTVRRPAGESYLLQHYAAKRDYRFDGDSDNDYLIGILHPGHGEDDVDITSILTEQTGNSSKVIASRTIKLAPDRPWRRRFNLLEPVTLFVEFAQAGRYGIEASGVEAEVSLAPLIWSRDFRPLPSKTGGGVWDLDSGFYTVTLTPHASSRGIVTLSMHGAGGPEAQQESPALLGESYLPQRLSAAGHYRLLMNQAPGPGFGALLRKLPVDLSEDIPLMLSPGESAILPVKLAAAGRIEARSEDNAVLPVDFVAAEGKAIVTNPVGTPVLATVHLVPSAKPPAITLPPTSVQDLKKLPNFPVLSAQSPNFLDLTQRQSATFDVKVTSPALYRLETTGLLQTSGNLRTQLQLSLLRGSANGVGRNMLLQSYLREGLYQLTVNSEGQTAGHLGVKLTAAPVQQGGFLFEGTAAHASLAGNEGLNYDFEVPETANYHLHSFGLAGPAVIRLEDDKGWPLTRPGQQGDLIQELQPGRYHLVVMPQPLPARILTVIDRVREVAPVKGHGPHPLALSGDSANLWEEPAEGAPRLPDVWTFTLPAEVTVTMTLGELMQGEIKREGEDQPLASFNFRAPWHDRLPAGRYRLEVTSVVPNNRLDYTVTTGVDQLTAGGERDITAPFQVPLAVGGDELVELSSFGVNEVRAALLDSSGRVVARGTERPDDWNFNISLHVAPGNYLLKVDPMGQATAVTTVRARQLAESADPPLAAGQDRALADGVVHSIPLDLKPGDGPLLLAEAESRSAVGLLLEEQGEDGSWRPVGAKSDRSVYLAMPRDPAAGRHYRLQIWSVDHSPTPIALKLRAVKPATASEGSLAGGEKLSEISPFGGGLGALAVKLDQPGLLHLDQPADSLAWAAAPDSHAVSHGPDLVVAGGTTLWFVGEMAQARVQAKRVLPDGKAPLSLTLPEGDSASIPVTSDSRGPILWVAESRVGQPGISVGPLDSPRDAKRSGFAAGVAAAILPELRQIKSPVVRLWRADGAGELPMTLQQLVFAKPSAGKLDWGIGDRALQGHAAESLDLPDGLKRFDLALPPRMAAALLTGDAVERVIWSGDQPASVSIESASNRLLLLNAGPEEQRLSLSVSLAGEASERLRLAHGGMLRQTSAHAGALLIDVALAEAERNKGVKLHLAGPVEEALLQEGAGAFRSGSTLDVAEEAVLSVRHGPGLLTAWLDNGDEQEWLSKASAQSGQPLPATLALSGPQTAWRFDAGKPGLLHVGTESPAIAGAMHSGGAPDLTLWPQGANLHLFMPAGSSSLVGLRPMLGSTLSGTVRLARSEAIAMAEGLGPKVRLAPGDARLFAFTLAESGSIGVGVRGEADTARVQLFDDKGAVLATGTLAMASLPAGQYFLLVENRADAAATDLQPALVGAVKPARTPPEEIKRRYWQLLTEESDKAAP